MRSSSSTRLFPSVQQLLALREVGVRGTTSAAARALHRSQPAVTQAIASLERRLNCQLFLRTPSGMVATIAGGIALRRVSRALGYLAEGIRILPTGRGRQGKARNGVNVHSISGTQLLALAAVVEAGGFGAAARLTGLSRASLHRSCRALESKLGVDLFETTSHGIEATRDAKTLARRMQLASAELLQARAEIDALTGANHARIVIGAMPLARSSIVPATILMFVAKHPAHTITILDGPYETLLAALRNGSADILIGALREPIAASDVLQHPLFDDPIAIVARAGHPILKSAGAAFAHFKLYPWIAPRKGTPLRSHFDSIFERIGTPAGIVECNSLSAARALILAGDYLMLLSAHQIRADLAAGFLALISHPSGTVVRHIGITIRKDWHPTASQQEFLENLRAVARHET